MSELDWKNLFLIAVSCNLFSFPRTARILIEIIYIKVIKTGQKLDGLLEKTAQLQNGDSGNDKNYVGNSHKKTNLKTK